MKVHGFKRNIFIFCPMKKKKIYYFIEKTKKQGEYQQKYIRLHDEKK